MYRVRWTIALFPPTITNFKLKQLFGQMKMVNAIARIRVKCDETHIYRNY